MFNNINLTLDLRINNIEYLQVIETLYLKNPIRYPIVITYLIITSYSDFVRKNVMNNYIPIPYK